MAEGKIDRETEVARLLTEGTQALFFVLIGPDGHVWRLFEDGRTEGFANGTHTLNLARPFCDLLRVRLRQAEARLERVVAALPKDREEIGRKMHESWSATKRAQGYHGPDEICPNVSIPCPGLRADLVPWEELPPGQQAINRAACDAILGPALALLASPEYARYRDNT